MGSGYETKKGYVNVDFIKVKGVDVVHDLNKFPYPFDTNSADEIFAAETLEHLEDTMKVLEEFRRILKPGGRLVIEVPHFSAPIAHNPFHKTFWHATVFDQFSQNSLQGTAEQHNWFKQVNTKILFPKGILFWNHAVEWFTNLSKTTRYVYETSLCYIFPSERIVFNIKNVK